MKIPRVLVVEDEKAIAELISVNLRHHGMLAVLATIIVESLFSDMWKNHVPSQKTHRSFGNADACNASF